MPLVAAAGPLIAGMGGAASVASAAIGAGASIYAANKQSSAARRAIDAQQQATNQSIAAQERALAQVQANNQPFMQGGVQALDALLAEYGLGSSSQPSSQYDVRQYIQNNPDVAAARSGLEAQGVIGPNGRWATFEDWVANEQLPNAIAAGEQRDYPMLDQSGQGGGQTTLQQQIEALGGRPQMERPDFYTADYVAPPNEADYFSNFQESPGYQFLLQEAMRNVNVARYSRGVGSSGGTLRELQNRAVGLAAQDYNNWFNRQNTLYQTAIGNSQFATNFNLANAQQRNALAQGAFESDRLYANANFDADRNFLVNENQRRIGNLAGLAGMGQSAASGVNSAALGVANNTGNQLNINANALAAGYGQIADARASGVNALAGIGQGILAGVGSNNTAPSSVPKSTGNKPKPSVLNFAF